VTNLGQKGATLVLMPGNPQFPEVLFLPRRNPARETWTGHMYSPQEAGQLSGIKEIWEASEFPPFISALAKHEAYRPKLENILASSRGWYPGTPDAAGGANGFEPLFAAAAKKEAGLYLLWFPPDGESQEYRQEQKFAAAWSKEPGGFAIQNASPILARCVCESLRWNSN